jgi:hypothetical protein
MYSHTMHEALARERLRDLREQSRRSLASAELATARRWHRLELRARAAERRHTRQSQRRSWAVTDAVTEHSWR